MMLPPVPHVNPTQLFTRPTGPMAPHMGMNTPQSQQLLTLLGGLGGMPSNPLAPGITRSPQPGPPTPAATQILGALGGAR